MPGEQRPHKRARRLRIDPIPDIEAAKVIRTLQIAIDERNALSGAILSDDELEQEMPKGADTINTGRRPDSSPACAACGRPKNGHSWYGQ
jgi:hypothetical protein